MSKGGRGSNTRNEEEEEELLVQKIDKCQVYEA